MNLILVRHRPIVRCHTNLFPSEVAKRLACFVIVNKRVKSDEEAVFCGMLPPATMRKKCFPDAGAQNLYPRSQVYFTFFSSTVSTSLSWLITSIVECTTLSS